MLKALFLSFKARLRGMYFAFYGISMLDVILTVLIVSQTGEPVVSLISRDELATKVIPIPNWGDQSRVGVCDGINWFNYLNLRGRVHFVKDSKIAADSAAEILKKFLLAKRNPKSSITIYGYESSQELFDDPPTLKFLIEGIYDDRASEDFQSAAERIPGQTDLMDMLSSDPEKRNYRGQFDDLHQIQVRNLTNAIDLQTPVRLAIFGAKSNWGHALTVVGYKRKTSESVADSFYVLDPLFPRKFQKLELKKAPDGKTYWYSPSLKVGLPEDFKSTPSQMAEVVVMQPDDFEKSVWQRRKPDAEKAINNIVTSVANPPSRLVCQ